jgi:dihydrofolate reductase
MANVNLRTSVFIGASLDGYIARSDGDIEWLHQSAIPGEDHGYADFVRTIDVLVIGRATFEKVLTFASWPYGAMRVVVLSRTLTESAIPEALRGTVAVHTGPVNDGFYRYLLESGATHAYIDGGQVIQSFLREDLIDEMIIARIPVLLGSGLSLFGELRRDLWWEHVSTRTYPNGVVQSTYRRIGRTGT